MATKAFQKTSNSIFIAVSSLILFPACNGTQDFAFISAAQMDSVEIPPLSEPPGGGEPPVVVQPPTVNPPTVNPPTVEPPTVEPPVVPPVANCDPDDPINIITQRSQGIIGTIHPVTGGSLNGVSLSSARQYVNQPAALNADGLESHALVKNFFIPTRAFTAGFVDGDGAALKINQQVLIEYFGIHFKGKIRIPENGTEGDYIFSLLSDDGSKLYIDGNLIVNNDVVTPTRMGCWDGYSNGNIARIRMEPGVDHDLELMYFQGPRYHIALSLLWKKVSADASQADLKDPACGSSGNDLFFKQNAQGQEIGKYKDLQARGWEPVPESMLSFTESVNRCSLVNISGSGH